MNEDICELLDWDSRFWGITVARVREPGLTAARAAAVNRWCRERNVDCLYYLAAADDLEGQHVAEGDGYRLMDVRVEMRADAVDGDDDPLVRPFRESDLERLLTLARERTFPSRFTADPNFPDEQCRLFYATWIERVCREHAVMVAEVDGRPVGCVDARLDGADGRLTICVVDEGFRGAGIGVALGLATRRWWARRGAGRGRLVISARNLVCLRSSQRAGFITDNVSIWFHKWYGQ